MWCPVSSQEEPADPSDSLKRIPTMSWAWIYGACQNLADRGIAEGQPGHPCGPLHRSKYRHKNGMSAPGRSGNVDWALAGGQPRYSGAVT